MSRSALWRQEANIKERERLSEEAYETALVEGRNRHVKGQIPLVGSDTTFNMNPMLVQNIAKSPYFIRKCCGKLMDWNAVVDEIYYEVNHVEPWTKGASRVPSTAFCLLLRLFTLRLTEKQMSTMLQHPDSPYIRCIAILYLRFACDPHQLFKWLEPYMQDREEFQMEATSNHKRPMMTIGGYIRKLMSDMNYFSTLLPRLPLTVERETKAHIMLLNEIDERGKQHFQNREFMEYISRPGSTIKALYGDEENPITWYDAVIDRIIPCPDGKGQPKFIVTFPEYGNTETVVLGEIDFQHSNSRSHSSLQDGSHKDYYMDRVREQERDATATSRKNYASRPMTMKGSLSTNTLRSPRNEMMDSHSHRRGYSTKKRAHYHEDNEKYEKSSCHQYENPKPREGYEKKRKLMDRYG